MSGFENLGVTPAEFMNTVRARMPESYKSQLPIAEAGQTSFTGVGQVLAEDDVFHQKWHRTAITLVAELLMHDNKIVNPLGEFEDSNVATTGDKIEETIIDTAATFAFNPSIAEKKLFERRAPELKAAIHTKKRDVSNSLTLQDTVYTEIFRDIEQLDHYVVQVTQSMLSGNEFEKYYTTKELISRAVYEGRVRTLDLGTHSDAKNVQKAILQVAKKMVHPSRFFNMGNVGQPDNHGETGINIQADRSQLRMILPIETSVNLNVDFFANVFHQSAIESNLAIKEVDYFPNIYEYVADHVVTPEDLAKGFLSDWNHEVGQTVVKGSQATEEAYKAAVQAATDSGGEPDIELKFDASRIRAVILDRRAIIIRPQLPLTLGSQPNALGRYTNIILNEKTFYSFSAFMPSCVILSDDNPDSFVMGTPFSAGGSGVGFKQPVVEENELVSGIALAMKEGITEAITKAVKAIEPVEPKAEAKKAATKKEPKTDK